VATKSEAARANDEIAVIKAALEPIREKARMADTAQKQAQIAEEERAALITEVAALKKQNDKLEQEVAVMNAIARFRRNAHPKAQHGKVVAAQPDWGFTVLNVGDRQGAKPNSNFLVVRGKSAVGQVKISSVERNQSIADIVPGTFVRGDSVRRGDEVIEWSDKKEQLPK
jgi:hypothetical protein